MRNSHLRQEQKSRKPDNKHKNMNYILKKTLKNY